MDRVLRLRSPTNFKQEYKKRGVSIDKRALRAHCRTADQQANRDKSYMCRRGGLPRPRPRPPASKVTENAQLKERVQNIQRNSEDKIEKPVDPYREKLKKWKEEKLLKEKLKRKGKENKLFKVCKVTYDKPAYLSEGQNQIKKTKTRSSTKNKNNYAEKQQAKASVITEKGNRKSARIAAKNKVKDKTKTKSDVDYSFAPANFIFNAPDNISTIQSLAMTPCTVQKSFLPDSKFNDNTEYNRRCSTPRSASHIKLLTQAFDLSVIHTTGKTIDATNVSSSDMPAYVMKPTTNNLPNSPKNSQMSLRSRGEGTESKDDVCKAHVEEVKLQDEDGTDTCNKPDETVSSSLGFQEPMLIQESQVIKQDGKQEISPDTEDTDMDLEKLTTQQSILPEGEKVLEISIGKAMHEVKPEVTTQEPILPDGEKVLEVKVMDEAKPELSVPYFRSLLQSNTDRLNRICENWEAELKTNLTEDIMGDIRTSIGKAKLLISQRFKQFSGLVDNCEFGTGTKETTCTDLQGFWEMVYIQVEDVNEMFKQLDTLKENKWVKTVASSQPKVKKIMKKKKVGMTKNKSATSEAAKQRLAAIKAAMKKKQRQNEEEKIVFEGGFFKVESPLKVRQQPHCQAGTPLRMVMQKSIFGSPSNATECKQPQAIQTSLMDKTTSPYAFRTPRRGGKSPNTQVFTPEDRASPYTFRTPRRGAKTPTTAAEASSPKDIPASPYDLRTPRKCGRTPTTAAESSTPKDIPASPYNLRTPRRGGRTPTTPASMTRSAARKMTDLNRNTPVSGLKLIDKTSLKNQELNNSFSKFLQPSLNLVDLNDQAEELMVTEPSQQLNDLLKTPIQNGGTLEKKEDPFSSQIEIKNVESQNKIQSPNYSQVTKDLICFDSPIDDGNEELGLVERIAAISLPNNSAVFSPVRRSARIQSQESDHSKQNLADDILFSPLTN